MSHIEIDKQTIKALSADARVNILKMLKENRRIAADISKEIGLAPSTVNEHLKMMEDAGLIRKNITGHKWIYYDITEKGKSMVTPKMPISIILTLSLGIGLALFGGMSFLAENIFSGSASAAMQSTMEKAAEISSAPALSQSAGLGSAAPAINWLPLALLAAGLVLVVFGFIKLRRK
ncbi:MAG: winged helix-turn-helix domain-containing protein [Candidatus Aenigmatarchaeota archaeon]